VGLHRWGPLLAGLGFAALVVAPLSATEPSCAYVLGQTGSTTVAMPAIPLIVPSEDTGPSPVRNPLDEPGRTSLGYTLSPTTCASEGGSTLALVVPVPASRFEHPESLMEVGAIVLDLGAAPVSRPGHVLPLEGGDLLILPQPGDATPSTAWDLPEPSITFRLGGILTTAHYFSPTRDQTLSRRSH
jgi:hypothetical protein